MKHNKIDLPAPVDPADLAGGVQQLKPAGTDEHDDGAVVSSAVPLLSERAENGPVSGPGAEW